MTIYYTYRNGVLGTTDTLEPDLYAGLTAEERVLFDNEEIEILVGFQDSNNSEEAKADSGVWNSPIDESDTGQPGWYWEPMSAYGPFATSGDACRYAVNSDLDWLADPDQSDTDPELVPKLRRFAAGPHLTVTPYLDCWLVSKGDKLVAVVNQYTNEPPHRPVEFGVVDCQEPPLCLSGDLCATAFGSLEEAILDIEEDIARPDPTKY